MTKDEQWPFGPFLWFGTSSEEVDDYGPYPYEFHLKSILNKAEKEINLYAIRLVA